MTRSDLIGRWRLVSYTTGSEHPMGPDAAGVLQYSADGKVSVHIMGEGYFAYYGDYTLDDAGSAVTHHLELCSDPALVGADNRRDARLEGRRLTLSGSMQLGGRTREIRVVWDRDDGRRNGITLHSGPVPGCIGRVAELHGRYYAGTVGFGTEFEAKVARELGDFALRFDPGRDGLWLAMDGGEIHGSIVIDGRGAESEGAHLRWFILSDACRGQGVGKDLLAAALAFCRQKSYPQVHLWTFDQLPAARHLYESSGFRLELERKGTTWGKEVNEQKFVLRIA